MAFLPDDNLDYPAFITVGAKTGSGFLLRSGNHVYLVTAKHVIFNGNDLNDEKATVKLYNNRFKDHTLIEINLMVSIENNYLRRHSNVDLCVIQIIANIDESKFLDGVRVLDRSAGWCNSLVLMKAGLSPSTK